MRSAIAASLLAATALLGATTGCSSSTAPANNAAASNVDVASATLIDVRTPAEFAEGHLEGATNINLQSADFTAQISQLPKNAEYVIYCRSGNRSAQAIEQMSALGFTNLLDAGSVSEASATTGKPVIR